MNDFVGVYKAAVIGAFLLTSLGVSAEPTLALEDAIDIAIRGDPWSAQSIYLQRALLDESVAAGALPDPRITLGAANLPTDTFDTGQEGMTQATIGLSQRFPRGDSRSLARAKKIELAESQSFQRENRQELVVRSVTYLWLELWKAQESIRIIDNNRGLFEQLADVAEAGYTSTLTGSRQQDIIRGSLELTRLDDRLTGLHSQLETAQEELGEWVGADTFRLRVSERVPSNLLAKVVNTPSYTNGNAAITHASIRATDQLIDAGSLDIELARQAYKPEWTVSAQYGYRDQTTGGQDRADLFSVGIGFDLPFFTGNRQDRTVSAAIARVEAAKSDRMLQVRRLTAEARAAAARINRLDDRIMLYQQTLLPQIAEQANAALSAYNNDDGDFAEAVRARIAELNAQVDFIQMTAERAKNVANFRYLTADTSDSPSFSLKNSQD
ncbi:outer membrane protein TolC [Marinobacter sp. LV10R520-4]|uniref:TolC family protein n=1 Tax=Marinobacter sp. LV10R520-4 TaxID=1761796 RepID=UPI000BFA5286|nr:TolC family protein [Marinobacter sp. LV10R520-4]PFG54463.1 outer membrane protein TolC [Marinobacter sp. LV10R520-4]